MKTAVILAICWAVLIVKATLEHLRRHDSEGNH